MRALGQNEVVMVFQISPSAPELAQMNFSTYIATSFANGGVTATYDPDTAQLTTAVLYT